LGLAHLVYSIISFVRRRVVVGVLSLVGGSLFVIPIYVFLQKDGYTAVAALAVVTVICGAGWLIGMFMKRLRG